MSEEYNPHKTIVRYVNTCNPKDIYKVKKIVDFLNSKFPIRKEWSKNSQFLAIFPEQGRREWLITCHYFPTLDDKRLPIYEAMLRKKYPVRMRICNMYSAGVYGKVIDKEGIIVK